MTPLTSKIQKNFPKVAAAKVKKEASAMVEKSAFRMIVHKKHSYLKF